MKYILRDYKVGKGALENMATEPTVIEKPPVYIITRPIDFLQAAVIGAAAGLLVKLLSEGLDRYFIEPVFCRGDQIAVCTVNDQVALGAANVIVVIIAVVIMFQLNVFRPLLVAAAVAASFWGINSHITGINAWGNGYEQTAWFVLLYALGYLLFFWLLRLRNFALSLVITLAAVIILRLILVYS